MQFLDYKNNVEQILARKQIHMKDINVDMDAMFEAYINSVKPIDFIKSMYTLNESYQTDKFTDYYNKVKDFALQNGFRIIKMPRELKEEVINFYNEGYNSVVAGKYITEQIKKNSIKQDKAPINADVLKNKLLLLTHDITDCALKNVELNRNEAKAILKIKIFEMRNEISTDIKSYVRELNKYFAAYLRQNIDNNTRIEIMGYNIVGRSVFVTVKMKIDYLETEDSNGFNFSANETANIIEMYINVFKTFAEQYRNIV